MNCLKRKNESKNHVLELVLVSVAYSMLDTGYPVEEVNKVLDNIMEVCDSISGDYVKFSEIKRALRDEYGFDFDMHY